MSTIRWLRWQSELVGDVIWLFHGRSRDYHHFMVTPMMDECVDVFGGVWCHEVAYSWRCLRLRWVLDGRNPMVGLFVVANVTEIFSCAACVPLIMMWFLDLLASLFINGQKFK